MYCFMKLGYSSLTLLMGVCLLICGNFNSYAFGQKSDNNTTGDTLKEPLPSDLSVMASVRVEKTPPQITISWPAPNAPAKSYEIYRRLLEQRDWSEPAIAILKGDATAYSDVNVQSGVSYEYRIDRNATNYSGCGYICAGIDLPLVEGRGTVLLLVDSTIARSVKAELQRLQQDLTGDGWSVLRIDVPRSACVPDVKEIIVSQYRQNPLGLKSVFLFGHIAVPYSGVTPLDGHPDHSGAWPADVFYGTIDFPWTDTADYTKSYTNKNAPRNWNKPNDGKYDQSNLPKNSVKLQIGRVDLSNMPAFNQNEVELLRQYLNKNHRFRHGQFIAERRGIVKDAFGLFNGEAFSAGGWYNQSAFYSADNVSAGEWFSDKPRLPYLLSGYGCGGGSMTSCGGFMETKSFALGDPGVVFTTLFGSYFGDWDYPNNLLRAVLASPNTGLTSVWSGCPPIYLHHMGLGIPIGYSMMRSQDNGGLTDYKTWGLIKEDGTKNRSMNDGGGSVVIALMGDPTLRLFVVPPPADLQALIGNDRSVTLHWTASNDAGVSGYNLYRRQTVAGPFVKLTETPVNATSFTDLFQPDSPVEYMIKAIKLEQSGSGTFYNSSQGVYLPVDPRKTVPQAPIVKDLGYSVFENQSVKIRLDASTPDGQAVSYCFSQPGHGVLTGKAPNLNYIPNPYYSGPDTFTYTAIAQGVECSPAIVTLQVFYVKDTPTADDLIVARHRVKSIPITLPVIDHHNHPLSYTILTPPKYGTVSGENVSLLHYTPTTTDNVADLFTYTVSCEDATSAPATVILEANYPCPKCTKPITIDGNTSEWSALPYDFNSGVKLTRDLKQNWQGQKDCWYRFGVCYDDEMVYFAISVIDNKIIARKDATPWEQDSFELRIDARADAVRQIGTGENEMQDFLFINMSPTSSAGESIIYSPEKLPLGSKYACVYTKKGYDAEIAIPISYFVNNGGEDWDGFRLNVAVDDIDKVDGLRKQYWWKPDWRSWSAFKSYEGSGSFFRQ